MSSFKRFSKISRWSKKQEFELLKTVALMEGRNYVLPEDVKEVVYDILRHRLLLSYKATIQKISPDLIIKEILESVKVE